MSSASGQVDPGDPPVEEGIPLEEGVELPAARTASSSTYRLEDGRYATVISAVPVNYQAEDGSWRPIDNTLVASSREGFAWENRAGAYRLLVPSQPGRDPVRFEAEGAWISFALREVAPTVAASVDRNAVRITPFEGVVVRWLATNTGVKEEIVLANAAAANSFAFDVRLAAGLTLQAREDGGVDVVRAGGERAFSFAPAYMVDSSGRDEGLSTEVAYELEQTEGGYLLRVVADREWLTDPARVWPVTIDPTITLEEPDDCHINEVNPTTVHCGQADLKIGGNSDYRRLLLRFDLGAEVPERTITDADLALWCEDGSTTNNAFIDVRRVTKSWTNSATWVRYAVGSNWANQGGDFGGTDAATRETNCSFASWKLWTSASGWSMAGLVNDWIDGTYPNQGVILKQQGENINNLLTLTATDDSANQAHWPELRVTFSNTAPSGPEDLSPEYETVDYDPTPVLSGTYADSDPGDTGRLKFRVLSCPDEFCDTYTVVASADGNVVLPGQTSSWTAPTLTGGTTYYWQAQSHDGVAYNGGSAGQWTEPQEYHVFTGPAATDLEPSESVSYETEPTLSAKYTHPAGLSGKVQFSVETLDGTIVANGDGTWVSSGQTSSWTVPSGALSDSEEYVWSAVATDGSTSSSQPSLASYETEPGPDQAEVEFESPMQVADAILWAELNLVRPIDLLSTYEDLDESVTLAYHVEDLEDSSSFISDAEAVAVDYTETMANTMFDVMEELDEDPEATADQVTHAGWIEASISSGDIPIKTLRVSGPTPLLEELILDPDVSSVVIRSEESGEGEGGSGSVACPDDWPPEPWAPWYGRVHTKRMRDKNDNLLPKRSIYQSFRWTPTRLANMLCDNPPGADFGSRTYEADAHFLLKGGTYFGKKKSYASNMPKKYFDTNLSEGKSKAWTVGTREAWDLIPNKLYWTKVVTKLGKASKDRGNIFGQVGLKEYPLCGWPICIFGYDEDYFIGNFTYRAPSLETWSNF